jgi:hypothetical protein
VESRLVDQIKLLHINPNTRSQKLVAKKVHKPKLIRVLLDSGSDGDLLFHKTGTPK